MNKSGTLAGWADTPTKDSLPTFCFNFDCYVSHALLWRDGSSNDLGVLAAGWSSAAIWINKAGEIVGISQNGVIDPAIGFPEERGVLWSNGTMIDLGTLGGNQSAGSRLTTRAKSPGSR